jgi:glycosyltransferase involved in cell wall biosynthesis
MENDRIMTNQKKIVIIGSFCNVSGYSDHARVIADAFLSSPEKPIVHLIDLQWAEATRNAEYSEKYGPLIENTQQYLKFLKSTNTSMTEGFDCCFQVRPPNEWHKVTNYDIGVTAALETVAAPKEWIPNCNMVQKILVVSDHSKQNLLKAFDSETKEKITTPIEVVPFYNNLPDQREKFSGYEALTTNKNFLCVSQLAPRKNLFDMIGCYLDEFMDDNDASLIVKTYIRNNSRIDEKMTSDAILKFLNFKAPDRKCKVQLIHGNLSQDEIASLYDPEVITGYISHAHGEGFGIPIFNAVCADIPVIAPSWSGHLDFLNAPVTNNKSGKTKRKNLFLKTSYTIDKVNETHLMPGLITAECEWCYPEDNSLRKNLKNLIASPATNKKDAILLGKYIREKFSQENINQMYYKILDGIGSSYASGETSNTQILEL